MQLFKLRNTWAQYVPNSTLYELDIRISRTDPNWPIASPHNGSSNALPVKANASHQKMIHVNPKFLQVKFMCFRDLFLNNPGLQCFLEYLYCTTWLFFNWSQAILT